MAKEFKGSRDAMGQLRRRAEALLARSAQHPGASAELADAVRLLHELDVHRVELELQNEALQAARADLELGLTRFKEIFDFAPIGYAILAPDGRIREVNHVGAQILGAPRALLVDAPFVRFVELSHHERTHALLDAAWDGESKAAAELTLEGPPDRRVELRVTATVTSRPAPELLLAFEDVTERTRLDQQLERSEAALRDADRRKDEFLAVLSHELRNPLAPIRNSLYVLAHAAPGSPKAERARVIIDRQFDHLSRLVDDLLDVTRISRGKISLQREVHDLRELVGRSVEDHRIAFESDGLRLGASLGTEPLWVDVDPARITQVVSNVLVNAEKFTPRGGSVDVELLHVDGNAVVRVRDSGIGVLPAVAEHLFTAFSQAPQTIDRSRGGLGLGLAMVKGLVELHGGTVRLYSEGTGRGTEVVIHLPLCAAPHDPRAPEPPPSPVARRRVLVIDDSPDVAESLEQAVSLWGHEVRTAGDGRTGLELAQVFRPDVILCDLGLPGLDGYDVARAIRAEPSLANVALVALSGYAQPEDRRRALAAGFDEHLAKPPAIEALRRVVDELRPSKAPAPAAQEGASPAE